MTFQCESNRRYLRPQWILVVSFALVLSFVPCLHAWSSSSTRGGDRISFQNGIGRGDEQQVRSSSSSSSSSSYGLFCGIPPRLAYGSRLHLASDENGSGPEDSDKDDDESDTPSRLRYDLGVGKNQPLVSNQEEETLELVTTRRMIARDKLAESLRGALWDESHYEGGAAEVDQGFGLDSVMNDFGNNKAFIRPPTALYPDIDLSIPESVYSDDGSVDLVWDLLRWEAYQETQREPLLVSFLYSTILNHQSLESSLAFLLANRLQSPAMMISTQLQSLIVTALANDPVFRRSLRADIMAVRDRDPACTALPDVFLYFKGFHALQAYRVAHSVYKRQSKRIVAQYLQSQVSKEFQIDIHPNATLGSGLMLDHGTGIVIGSTASVGCNCSILHHVTLGGSGKKGVIRHPQIGNGVLLGAGATVLGPVSIGDGSQVGAGTLVISDLPAHSVAVGVPARQIGRFVDVTEQPSRGMNQNFSNDTFVQTFESFGI